MPDRFRSDNPASTTSSPSERLSRRGPVRSAARYVAVALADPVSALTQTGPELTPRRELGTGTGRVRQRVVNRVEFEVAIGLAAMSGESRSPRRKFGPPF